MSADQDEWVVEFEGSTPWELLKKLESGRELELGYTPMIGAVVNDEGRPIPLSMRDELTAILVQESDDAVEIALHQRHETLAGDWSAIGFPVRVRIVLERPLGSRELRHAPVDSEPGQYIAVRADYGPLLQGVGDGASAACQRAPSE